MHFYDALLANILYSYYIGLFPPKRKVHFQIPFFRDRALLCKCQKIIPVSVLNVTAISLPGFIETCLKK